MYNIFYKDKDNIQKISGRNPGVSLKLMICIFTL